MSAGPTARRLVAFCALGLAIAGGARGEGARWVRAGDGERIEVGLGGSLVAALAAEPDGPILVLARPEGEVDGPRRLLALARGATPDLLALAEGVGGWTKALAAVELDGGAELVAAGLGRLASLGSLARPHGAARDLIEHPGFDLRSLAPGPLRIGVDRELAAAEVGALRIWRPAPGGSLELASETALPFAVERRLSGLRLSGLPVVELARDAQGRRRFAVGPEAAGAARLRVLLLAEGAAGRWTTTECWAALPAPEVVEASWIFDGDETPLLVVQSQGALEVNAFEDQLWRVFSLAPDRTRAGRRPLLALQADSKRWQSSRALVADGDGDGRRDLWIARPEGITGTDLVVERFAGSAGGRFESRSRRTDLDTAPSDELWLADSDGRGGPGLVTIVASELVVWRAAREGRRALEREPWLRVPIERGEGDARAALELLGAAPRTAAPPDLLILATPEKGESRLVLVRAPAR